MKKKLILLVLPLALALVCCKKKDNNNNNNNNNTSVNALEVNIKNTAFNPSTINVSKGATVTWDNQDNTTHTVTSDNGLFNSGNLTPGKQFRHTFDSTGTFTYHCQIHSNMIGNVHVQ